MVHIRKVKPGDEEILAYIQTESWKDGFSHIVSEDVLKECTDYDRMVQMYRSLLEARIGNGYILEVDGKPHLTAWWDASREDDLMGYAELICIHSLKSNWRKGYGSMMMERVLGDVRESGYEKIMLWVFEENHRAIPMYQKFGFVPSGIKKDSFGAPEEMYVKTFC